MIIEDMRHFWKIFAALALMLPLGAFVAGNLASAADDPAPRHTIVIDDQDGTPSADPTPSTSHSSRPDDAATHDQGDDNGEDNGDDEGDDSGRDGSDDASTIPEATQTPDDWNDDHG